MNESYADNTRRKPAPRPALGPQLHIAWEFG
jgi:hypothetical protein